MEGNKMFEVKVVLTRIDTSKMDMEIEPDNEDANTGKISENENSVLGHKRPRLAEPEDNDVNLRSSDETELDSEDGDGKEVETVNLKRRRKHYRAPLTPLRRIMKMKRMMALCNLYIRDYEEFWENCNTSEQKIQRMFEYMKENGLKGKPTISKCRKLGKLIKAKNQKNEPCDVVPSVAEDTGHNNESDDDAVDEMQSTDNSHEREENDETSTTSIDSSDSTSSVDTIDSMTGDPVDQENIQSKNTNNSPGDVGQTGSNVNTSGTGGEVQESPTIPNRTKSNITLVNVSPGRRSVDGVGAIVNGTGANGAVVEKGTVNARTIPSSNTTNNSNIVFGSGVSRNHLCIRRPLDGNVVPNTPLIGRIVTEQVTVRCGRNLPSSQGNIMMNNAPNSIRVMQFTHNPVEMRSIVPNDHSVCRVVDFANPMPSSYVRMPDNVIRGIIPLGQPCVGPRNPVCYTNTRIPPMPRPNVGFLNGIRNCTATPTLTYPYSGSNQGQQPNPMTIMNNHNDALGRINTLINQICSEGVVQEADVDFLKTYRSEIRRRIARIEATNFIDKLIEYESSQARPDEAISQKLKTILATLRREQN